jgi:tetratricopeptide (TPR) repeat protein
MSKSPCDFVTRNLTFEEWQRYFSDKKYERACDNHPLPFDIFDHARSLAREGKLTEAKDSFAYINTLDPTLRLDPIVEVKSALQKGIEELLAEAETLALDGNIKEAKDKLEQAIKLNPLLGFDPLTEAYQLSKYTGEDLLNQGIDAAEDGDIRGAVMDFENISLIDENFEIEAEDWHILCFEGARHQQAKFALKACDMAIELQPENGDFYDSRGIVRLQLGDEEGAFEDFDVFKH